MARTHPSEQHRVMHHAVLESWLAGHASANTRSAYRSDLDVFARWCALRGTTPLHADARAVAAFQRSRAAEGDSPSTLRRRWSALSSFFDAAVQRGAREDNPADGARRPKQSDDEPSPTALLSQDDVDECRELAMQLDPRLHALVSLIALDGLKLGEALALDVDHVTGRIPRVTVSVVRRGTPVRLLVDVDTAAALRRCTAGRASGPLFTSARPGGDAAPQRLSRFGADHLIRRLATAASNGERVTANALRRFHTVASSAAGDDVEEIRTRMGLADARSVRRHLRED